MLVWIEYFKFDVRKLLKMEKIQFKDIDFSGLQKLQYQGTKASLYSDGYICYKFIDGFYEEEKYELYKKLIDMDGIKIENVLLPRQLIMKENKLYGYTMDYFANSIPLSDKFLVRYVDCKKLFDYVLKASYILRDIHDHGIICQDLSFENILVTESGKVAFCDLDGCCYENHISPFISLLMKRFFIDYREERIPLSVNLDRISMLISFFYLIYEKEVQNLTKREYHKLSDEIKTLENLRMYANLLVDRRISICDIPYLDELIDIKDDCIYDREKQISFVRKLFRR